MSLFGSKKQNEIDKLINENDELKNQLHSVLLKQGGFEELEKNLARTKKEFAEASQKLETLNKDVSSLELNKAEQEKYLGDLNSKILDLEEIKESLNNTIQSYESQVALLEDRSKELDEKLSHSTEIEIKLAELTEKRDKLNVDIADKEQAFAYLSTIEREIQSDLEKERAECDQVKEQAENLRNELLELNANIENRQRQLELVIQEEEAALQKINNYKEDETRKTAIIKSLEERISLNEEIKNNLEASLGGFITQFSSNEQIYHEQSTKRDALSGEILELQKERDELEYKLNFAKEQFGIFQAEAAKHTGMITTLGDEIRKIETLRDSLQSDVENLNLLIEKHSAEIEITKNTLESLEKRKSELEEINLNTELDFISIIEKFSLDIAESQKNRAEIEQTIEDKRKDLFILEKSWHENNAKISEQEGLLRLLEKEKSSLDKFIGENKKEKDSLTEALSSLRENVSKQNSLLTSLHYENESLHIKKGDLQRDLALLMAQISKEYGETENRLSSINNEIADRTNISNELNSRISTANEELNNLYARLEEAKEKEEKPAGNFYKLTEFEKNSDEGDDNDNPQGFGINPLIDGMNDD